MTQQETEEMLSLYRRLETEKERYNALYEQNQHHKDLLGKYEPERNLPEEFLIWARQNGWARVANSTQWDQPGRSGSSNYVITEWVKSLLKN